MAAVPPAVAAVLAWMAANPKQTAFHIVNGVIICTPAVATVPFLSALGFSAAGPVTGEYSVRIFSDQEMALTTVS